MLTPTPRSRRFFVLGLAAQLALVAGISLLAYLGALPRWRWIGQYDYLLHAVLVGPLALWLDGALDYRPIPRTPAPLGPAIVVAVAMTEEYLQRFSARRSSTWHDVAGNLVGIALFTLLGRALRARRRRSGARLAPTPPPGHEPRPALQSRDEMA